MKDGGYALYRYPLNVINKLGFENSKKGREKAKYPAMCEIRFSSSTPYCKLILKSLDRDCKIFSFIDKFQCSEIVLKKNKKQIVEIQVHERMEKQREHLGFNNDYNFRIVLSGNSRVVLYPFADDNVIIDTNSSHLLTYGSSISQGVGCDSIINSYVFSLSSKLGINILNKGLSGACLLEKEVVDYISSIKGMGYILEIGCNARGIMSSDIFENKFKYLIEKISFENPHKPIFIINILEVFENLYKDFDEIPYHEKNQKFISIIKKQIKKLNNPNVHLISGKKLITRIDGISGDLLHPSNFGHKELSDNLSKIIKKYI